YSYGCVGCREARMPRKWVVCVVRSFITSGALSLALGTGGLKAGAQRAGNSVIDQSVTGIERTSTAEWDKPDTAVAVGPGQLVEIVNGEIEMFDLSSGVPAPLAAYTLSQFFNYTSQTLYDPRVFYDSANGRWIALCLALRESGSTQYLFVAVSQSSNCAGPYYLFPINLTSITGAGSTDDLPRPGMNKDDLVIALSCKPAGAPGNTVLIAIPKATIYAGLPIVYQSWRGLLPGLYPAVVQDQSSIVWMVGATLPAASLEMQGLQTASPGPATLGPAFQVAVPAYSLPNDAHQPNATTAITTQGIFFRSPPCQAPGTLYAVQTVARGQYASVRLYRIAVPTTLARSPQLSGSADFYASPTSWDWNPSVTVNTAQDLYLCWSSVDPANLKYVQVRATVFHLHDRITPAISQGACVYQSGLAFAPPGQSSAGWGDFSTIVADPVHPHVAWGVNECVQDASNWGSILFQVCAFHSFDLTGSGQPDLLFQNSNTGDLAYWLMLGAFQTSAGLLSPSSAGALSWNVVASADLFGDGASDLIFQNSATGSLAYWGMTFTAQNRSGLLTPSNPGSPQWLVVGSADLDGDGHPDLILQNSATGAIGYYLMTGTTAKRIGLFNPSSPGSSDWRVVGAADINGDGQADLIFQSRSSGTLAYWLLNGETVVGTGLFSPSNPGSAAWRAVGLADIDDDGTPDMLFQKGSSGDLAYFLLNGSVATSVGQFSPVNPGSPLWSLVLP
ncbi:MAG TPA: VCBS repeat-containing protein, partial [Chthonomonadales bacterium]|nr:VCBS repeat-containing protein [Chthonomonadales bacterium]